MPQTEEYQICEEFMEETFKYCDYLIINKRDESHPLPFDTEIIHAILEQNGQRYLSRDTIAGFFFGPLLERVLIDFGEQEKIFENKPEKKSFKIKEGWSQGGRNFAAIESS